MDHKIVFAKGSDARNYVATCECGWAYSGTYRAVRERAEVHKICFEFEDRKWNDPRRRTEMPPSKGVCA